MFVTIISMEFVSATVKRDKVRRMVEKGSIKKILLEKAKKEEETQKVAKGVVEHNGAEKEQEVVKEQRGDATEKTKEANESDDKSAGGTEDEGSISDEIDDAGDNPEPSVVFI